MWARFAKRTEASAASREERALSGQWPWCSWRLPRRSASDPSGRTGCSAP
jgi:hypothetical protein